MDARIIITIAVAALGYFVDIFDLLLFSIVRIESLTSMGVAPEDMLVTAIVIINIQTLGLLVGGVLWGIMGDKKGRLWVLFGSILLYSLANIVNAFAQNVEQYAVLRFISGIGLAGELGAGITLASELLPARWRGYGTTFIAGFGLLGACFAAFLSEHVDWRTAYMVGGVMGLLILVLRVNVTESHMYERLQGMSAAARGDLRVFLRRPELIGRFIAVVMVGAPIWFVVSILFTFAPEFATDLGLSFLPTTASVIFWGYLGMAVGDFISGFIAQTLQSRKTSIFAFLLIMIAATGFWLAQDQWDETSFYVMMAVIGFGCGYWAMFVQVSSELFGTNLRATVTTVAPNLVRGLIIPMTLVFHWLAPTMGIASSGLVVGMAAICVALACLVVLPETFHRNLDYIER